MPRSQALSECWPSPLINAAITPTPPSPLSFWQWTDVSLFLCRLLRNWGICTSLQKQEVEPVPVGVCMLCCVGGTFISASRHLNTPKILPLRRNCTPTYIIWKAENWNRQHGKTVDICNLQFSLHIWPTAVVRFSSVTNSSKVQAFHGIVLILPVPSASPASTGEYHQNSFHFFFSLHRPAW